MKRIFLLSLVLCAGEARAMGGECLALEQTSAWKAGATKTVVVEAASERLEIVPATYQTVSETIVIQPAHCRGDEMKTVQQTVVVEETSESLQVIPATYKMVKNYGFTPDKQPEWRIHNGAALRLSYPGAVTGGHRTRVVDTPASVRRIAVPGRTATISIRVLTAKRTCPASQRVPATTRTIQRRVVRTPATVRSVAIPARTRQVPVDDGDSVRLSLVPVRCDVAGLVLGPFADTGAALAMPPDPKPGRVYRPVREALADPSCVRWLDFGGALPDPSVLHPLDDDIFAARGIAGTEERLAYLESLLGNAGYTHRRIPVAGSAVAVTRPERIDVAGYTLSDPGNTAHRLDILRPLAGQNSVPSGLFRIIAFVAAPKAGPCGAMPARWYLAVYEIDTWGAEPHIRREDALDIDTHIFGSGLDPVLLR